MNLSGCVALVTGSSSGIGAATAIALAKKNCKVAVTWSSNKKGGEDTLRECLQIGAEAELFKLDITDDTSCQLVVNDVVKKWGRLDILVNAAGVTRPSDPTKLEQLNSEDFLKIYQVNVVGAFQITRAAAPQLSLRPIAHIINVASTAAQNGRGSSMAYAASKGALITMTKSLARALGPTVRVNAICPGLVKTKWLQNTVKPEASEAFLRMASMRSTLKILPSAEQIAESIIGCVSHFDVMTGSSIVVDSGAHLGTAHLKQPST